LQRFSGRFGSVFCGTFRCDKVAIKYFFPQCEDSFQNETAIFHKPTINLRDEHIVGFVASDIFHSPQGEIKRIIVMDFIPAGSLRDFMSRNAAKIDEKRSLKMCESLVKGVLFLHCEINGQQGKEGIAHRDLSNTSVMVRSSVSDAKLRFALPGLGDQRSHPNFYRLIFRQVGRQIHILKKILAFFAELSTGLNPV
jgi:serine/threonine protein kinase